jgi:hypothetical protein
MNRPFAGIESDEAFLNLGARRFVGVPQADNPYRILSVSAAHLESTPTPRDLSEQLGITERQVHYYRQAAALLGLLSPDATGWKLTQAGRTVCESSDESARTALAQIIRQTPIIRLAQRKVHGLKDSGSRIRALAHVLSRCTALSGATCLRRAQTLLSWLDWADTHEINQKGFLLFDTISPAAEEPDDVAVA